MIINKDGIKECWCGHRHMNTQQARDNAFFNSRPVRNHEWIEIESISTHFTPQRQAWIEQHFSPNGRKAFEAIALLLEKHERGDFDYQQTMAIMRCIR